MLAVGRLSPEKRLEDLIVAHAESLPHLQLVLVGDTSYTDDYISRLRALAAPRVLFPGYLKGAALEELYSSALVFAIPSDIEGLSVSLLEAMSLGCPIVASNIAGNREALGDPPVGLTYAPRDCWALGSALRRLAEDASLRESLSKAACARAREAFNWDLIADATLEVYERALTRQRAV